MTVTNHELTILTMIEMTEDDESLKAIEKAVAKRRADVRRSNWVLNLIENVEAHQLDIA